MVLIPQQVRYLLQGFTLLAHSLYQFEAFSIGTLLVAVALTEQGATCTIVGISTEVEQW